MSIYKVIAKIGRALVSEKISVDTTQGVPSDEAVSLVEDMVLEGWHAHTGYDFRKHADEVTTLNISDLGEAMWDNYYTLASTPIQAMTAIWGDYESGTLLPWAQTEYGVDEPYLLQVIAELTEQIGSMDTSKTAMEAHQ